MPYKCWRILIAEDQPYLRVRIEKSLREMGCRRLTTAQSFRELLGLTHYSHEPFEGFELMIINGELLAATGIDPVRFFLSNPQIRHGLIHDARRGQPKAETIYASQQRQLTLIRTLDRQSLDAVLVSVSA